MLLNAWQKETDTEKSIYYDFIKLRDTNTVPHILLRYYLKDLSILRHVKIDTRYTLAKTSFAHPINSRRNVGKGA